MSFYQELRELSKLQILENRQDIELLVQVFNPANMKHNDYSKAFCIEVVMQDQTKTMALIGGLYYYDSDCAILEDDKIKLNDWNGNYYEIDLNGNLILMREWGWHESGGRRASIVSETAGKNL